MYRDPFFFHGTALFFLTFILSRNRNSWLGFINKIEKNKKNRIKQKLFFPVFLVFLVIYEA